eukprot:GDKJ01023397.1.p1 GENE.GDKJ01023397.1~~GDKJ01023397.1.p1  ORF type:complete len:566 (+),score=90.00 GDKJ01023397.1:161-1858(+)
MASVCTYSGLTCSGTESCTSTILPITAPTCSIGDVVHDVGSTQICEIVDQQCIVETRSAVENSWVKTPDGVLEINEATNKVRWFCSTCSTKPEFDIDYLIDPGDPNFVHIVPRVPPLRDCNDIMDVEPPDCNAVEICRGGFVTYIVGMCDSPALLPPSNGICVRVTDDLYLLTSKMMASDRATACQSTDVTTPTHAFTYDVNPPAWRNSNFLVLTAKLPLVGSSGPSQVFGLPNDVKAVPSTTPVSTPFEMCNANNMKGHYVELVGGVPTLRGSQSRILDCSSHSKSCAAYDNCKDSTVTGSTSFMYKSPVLPSHTYPTIDPTSDAIQEIPSLLTSASLTPPASPPVLSDLDKSKKVNSPVATSNVSGGKIVNSGADFYFNSTPVKDQIGQPSSSDAAAWRKIYDVDNAEILSRRFKGDEALKKEYQNGLDLLGFVPVQSNRIGDALSEFEKKNNSASGYRSSVPFGYVLGTYGIYYSSSELTLTDDLSGVPNQALEPVASNSAHSASEISPSGVGPCRGRIARTVDLPHECLDFPTIIDQRNSADGDRFFVVFAVVSSVFALRF